MNALLLALAIVAAEDPVKGSSLYIPKVGERAVLHIYDSEGGEVSPTVRVWTNTTALAKFYDMMFGKAFEQERTKVLGKKKELEAVWERQREAALKGPESRGEVIYVPDMTPVQVYGQGGFSKALATDNLFVEVVGGPYKGRFFWVGMFSVRVPGAKDPEILGFDGKKLDFGKLDFGDEEEKPAPAPRPTAKLLVEDSSWERKLDFVQVHCRVRNMTDQPIERITATVTYQDAAGKMVSTGVAIVGTLQPGEAKTFSTLDQHNPRMQQYVFEFEGRLDGENAGLTFTTTPPKNRRGR
jgi:hypothetical protein